MPSQFQWARKILKKNCHLNYLKGFIPDQISFYISVSVFLEFYRIRILDIGNHIKDTINLKKMNSGLHHLKVYSNK